MKLYQVTISNPIYQNPYYVVAGGMDEAGEVAQANELKDGGQNGGVESVTELGDTKGSETILLFAPGFEIS